MIYIDYLLIIGFIVSKICFIEKSQYGTNDQPTITHFSMNPCLEKNRKIPQYLQKIGFFENNRRILSIELQIEYDYEKIRYPIPFNLLYNNISYRYVDFDKKNKLFKSYVITGTIPEFENQYSDLLVETAASENHGYGSFNLMYSVLLADPYSSLLYIDLGLSKEQLIVLNSHFETLHQIQTKMKSNGFLAYRKYNWNSFPDWMNLFKNKIQRGGYSWKVVPLVDAFFEWKGLLAWLDAGNVIVDGITREVTLTRKYGLYTPRSGGNIKRWTHNYTRKFMTQHHLITRNEDMDSNCEANTIFFDYSHYFTRELLEKHKECGYTQKCISPRGSNMTNHRQDQAILSLLINDYHVPKAMSNNLKIHPSLRNEKGDIYQILSNLIISIQYTYHVKLANSIYNISSMKYNTTIMKYLVRNLDM